MIEKKDVRNIRNNMRIGQKVKCLKYVGGERVIEVEAEVIGKFPNLCLVTDKQSKWCVPWVDFAISGFSL